MQTFSEQNEPRVEPVNQSLRRKVVAGLVVVTVAGLALFIVLQEYILSLNDLGQSNPDLAIHKLKTMLMITSGAMGMGLIAGGLYLLDTARTIYATRRYPPEGMAILRDTRVLTGGPAQWRGIVTGALSILIIFGGMLIPTFTYVLVQKL